jgi:GDP-L-fucose synthase
MVEILAIGIGNEENKIMSKIVVTGGTGFLGTHVVKKLRERGFNVDVPQHANHDLRHRNEIQAMFRMYEPDIVIHLAAVCGGIGANQKSPGKFFYDNLIMGLEMIDVARDRGVEKFVQVGTVCAYPKHTPVPFKEEDIWNGYPEETNAPYGIAKKALLVQCQAYRQQYGMNAIYLVPVNLYGPGDNFDAFTSHVIPALIKKCVDAKKHHDDGIVVWGTGAASREFLYVEDCAEAIVLATEKYNGAEPVNIGSGSEIVMRDLVEVIKKATGFEGSTIYDASKPDGQPRRCLDTSRAEKAFGFKASTSFEEGIRKTVAWYESNFGREI